MAYIIGVDDVAKTVKDIAVGVDGTAHYVKSAYIGVDGVARRFYQRGYYEKRLYFFGYTGTLGSSLVVDKIYSVKPDGTTPVIYNLDTPIYAFYTTDSRWNPALANYDCIVPAKMFYDPNTQRLCVCGMTSTGYLCFYTIDCVHNTIIDKQISVAYSTRVVHKVYYSYELGCVVSIVRPYEGSQTVAFDCYNIRTLTKTSIQTVPFTGIDFNIAGFYVLPITNGIRLVGAYGKPSGFYTGYKEVDSFVFDWNLTNNTLTVGTPTQSFPVLTNNYYGCCFIGPHPFFNKQLFGTPVGVCFRGDIGIVINRVVYGASNTCFVIKTNGYDGTNFSIRPSFMGQKSFGQSNTHGLMWLQDNNNVPNDTYLAKYQNAYTEINGPLTATENNSGKTYDGPVIGGGVITGFSANATAQIYANIAGSYYNITPIRTGPYNMPICEGINLKEILIPSTNQVLVYDFNQAAYTAPISVENAGVSMVPYTGIISWTQEEQDALVNLGY